MSDWVELFAKDGDIPIKKGYTYKAIASIKTSHTKQDILNAVASYGLKVLNYAEQSPNGSYRQVTLTGEATKDGSTVPWKAPFPFSLADSSEILHVWVQAPGNSAPVLSRPSSSNGAGIILTLLGVGVIGMALYRYWLKR